MMIDAGDITMTLTDGGTTAQIRFLNHDITGIAGFSALETFRFDGLGPMPVK
jgi:hypothetical protein